MPELYTPENDENSSFDPNIDPQRIISIEKFIILSILTFGLYEMWWIYKAWLFFKQKENDDTIPAARAIFNIVFLYQLLRKILDFAYETGYDKEYPCGALYACFILTNFLSGLPQPFFLISLATFIFLLPPFRAFNYAIRNMPGVRITEQPNFSLRHIFLIIFGLFLWSSLYMSMTGQLAPLPAK